LFVVYTEKAANRKASVYSLGAPFDASQAACERPYSPMFCAVDRAATFTISAGMVK